MIKKLLFYCFALGLSINVFSKTTNIGISPVGSPAVATFSINELIVKAGDSVSISNNTTITIYIAIDNFPTPYPLPATATVTFSSLTAGFGSLTFRMTSAEPIILPASTSPLVIKEEGSSTLADTDGDGLYDSIELKIGTDPFNSDSDGDGIADGVEVGMPGLDADTLSSTDPLDQDTDGDKLTDGEEDKNKNGKVDANETDPENPNDPVVTTINGNIIPNNILSIYPQPANNTVNVNAVGKFEIINNQGIVVLDGSLNGQPLDISSLSSGVYQLFTQGKLSKLVIY